MFSPHLSRLKCIVSSMMRIPRVCNTPALFIAVVVSIFSLRAFAANPPCPLNATNRTVTICTPGGAAVVSNPVHLVAGMNDSNPVTSVQVLADGQPVFQNSAAPLDVYITSLSAGPHTLAVQAQDGTGT